MNRLYPRLYTTIPPRHNGPRIYIRITVVLQTAFQRPVRVPALTNVLFARAELLSCFCGVVS